MICWRMVKNSIVISKRLLDKEQISKILLTIIFVGGMYVLFSVITDYYRNIPFEFKNQFTAVSFAVMGICIHFIKKHKSATKTYQLLFESFELIMLVFTPIFVGFEIIQNFSPNTPIYKIILALGGGLFWFLATQYELSKPENKIEEKATLILSSWMYGGIISFCIVAVWLIIQLDAIPK